MNNDWNNDWTRLHYSLNDLHESHERLREALTNLYNQVDHFCETQGEADFELKEAKTALSQCPPAAQELPAVSSASRHDDSASSNAPLAVDPLRADTKVDEPMRDSAQQLAQSVGRHYAGEDRCSDADGYIDPSTAAQDIKGASKHTIPPALPVDLKLGEPCPECGKIIQAPLSHICQHKTKPDRRKAQRRIRNETKSIYAGASICRTKVDRRKPVDAGATPDDWIIAFDDFLNEPPQYEYKRMVREYRHSAYKKWQKVVHKIEQLQSRLRAAEQDKMRWVDQATKEHDARLVAEQERDGANHNARLAREDCELAIRRAEAAERRCSPELVARLDECERLLQLSRDVLKEAGSSRQWGEQAEEAIRKATDYLSKPAALCPGEKP